MRYVSARGREADETELYRAYVTETLRLRGEGKYIPTRWLDWVHPPEEIDAEEVKAGVIERAGLEVEHEPA